MYLYQVVMINGRVIEYEAERVESDDDRHVFYIGDEVVGEFERKNIAGYYQFEEEEEEDE